jgi:hypothetical protein
LFNFNINKDNANVDMSPSSMRANRTIEERILKEKKEIVAKLERQNREIIKEIKRLRLKQMASGNSGGEQPSQQQLQQLKPSFLNLKQQENLLSNGNGVTTATSSDECSGVDSPRIAGATIVDPLIISLNEQQRQKKGYNKVKSSTLLNSLSGAGNASIQSSQNSSVIAELQTLKTRKGQLETRMHMLKSSRDELLGQLEVLLKQSASNKAAARSSNGKTATSSGQLHLSSPRSLTLNSTQKYSSLINSNSQANGGGSNQNYNNISSSMNNNVSNSPLNAINVTVPGLSDMYANPSSLLNHATTTSLNISPKSSHNMNGGGGVIVPQVSASMAMHMPHQSRSMMTSSNSGSHIRSWSTPSNTAAPQFELHPSLQQNNQNLVSSSQQQQQQQQQSDFITAKNRVMAPVTGSASLAPSAHSSLLSLNALTAFGGGSDLGDAASNTGSTANLRNLR